MHFKSSNPNPLPLKALAQIFAMSVAIAVHANEDGPKTQLGGYGELHLNYVRPDTGHSESPVLDFHRFVLFFGHSFNDQWSLKAELELEHNVVEISGSQNDSVFELKKSGYLPLEQAILSYKHNDYLSVGAGVVLVPAGMLNTDHEPPLFLTVERPLYHNRIIPTTWFGNGIIVSGNALEGALRYQGVLTEGLNSSKISAKEGLRSARQKGLYASTASVLAGMRLDYDVLLGLTLGASYHQDQLMDNISGTRPYNRISLVELHTRYAAHGLRFTGEWAYVGYDALQNTSGLLKSGGGWYSELGYNVGHPLNWNAQVIPFFHLSQINPSSQVHGGGSAEQANEVFLWKVGLSVLPIHQVALKADYGITSKGDPSKDDYEFNLGVGYQF